MQLLGRYGLAVSPLGGRIDEAVEAVAQSVSDWIEPKGSVLEEGPPIRIQYRDGREAELVVSCIEGRRCSLRSWQLNEPIERGLFRTTIELAADDGRISLDVKLEAGTEGVLAPLRVDARCPGVIRTILAFPWPWELSGWTIPPVPLSLSGPDGGRDFVDLLADRDRTVPLVAVSEDGAWSEDFLEALRADVAGVGVVVSIDDDAAWELTGRLGRHWSCFNGALRIYWPRWRVDQDPATHPLWTQDRISRLRATEELAHRALRNSIRRRLLGLSTLGVRRDPLFGEVLNSYRELQRSRAKDERELLDIYAKENDQLRSTVADLEEQISRLKTDLDNLQTIRQWEETDEAGELEPDSEEAPSTVGEALELATARFSDQISFGDCVHDSVSDLAADAGPPPKVLRYLSGLNELALELRQGPLVVSHAISPVILQIVPGGCAGDFSV